MPHSITHLLGDTATPPDTTEVRGINIRDLPRHLDIRGLDSLKKAINSPFVRDTLLSVLGIEDPEVSYRDRPGVLAFVDAREPEEVNVSQQGISRRGMTSEGPASVAAIEDLLSHEFTHAANFQNARAIRQLHINVPGPDMREAGQSELSQAAEAILNIGPTRGTTPSSGIAQEANRSQHERVAYALGTALDLVRQKDDMEPEEFTGLVNELDAFLPGVRESMRFLSATLEDPSIRSLLGDSP